jgi:hypothetical protein
MNARKSLKKIPPGDWEGDTIESAGKNAYIATFVDRKTKLLLAKIMPDKTAAALNKAAVRAFKPIPAPMRNTLTPDNGKECAAHKALSQAPKYLPLRLIPFVHFRSHLGSPRVPKGWTKLSQPASGGAPWMIAV